MEREIYDRLIELTRHRIVELVGPNARKEADNLVNSQRDRWVKFLGSLNPRTLMRETGLDFPSYFLSKVNFSTIYSIETVGASIEGDIKIVVRGKGPILLDLSDEDTQFLREFSAESLVCVLYEWYVYFNADSGIRFSPKLNSEFFEYAFYRNSSNILSVEHRAALTQGLSDAKYVSERRESFDKELHEFIKTKQSEIDAFATSMKDDKRFRQLEAVWVNKKLVHSCLSFVLFVSIFLLIGGAVVATIAYKDDLLNILANTNVTPEKQYIAVVMILVPVLAFAWLLRLLMRMQGNYSNLAQDAKLREALIRTYLRLAAQDSTFSDKERLLMLNAIFRPLPGGQEEILPPSLADLVKQK